MKCFQMMIENWENFSIWRNKNGVGFELNKVYERQGNAYMETKSWWGLINDDTSWMIPIAYLNGKFAGNWFVIANRESRVAPVGCLFGYQSDILMFGARRFVQNSITPGRTAPKKRKTLLVEKRYCRCRLESSSFFFRGANGLAFQYLFVFKLFIL